MSFIGKNLPS